MKQIIFLTIISAFLFSLIRCKKDSSSDPENILLKYVDIIPDTTWIDFDNDEKIDIEILETKFLFFHGETEDLFIRVTYIISNNKNISISYGRLLPNYEVNILDKDSIIDGSLKWVDSFVKWGPRPYVTEKYDPNFIGIRLIKNNHTYYGWINNTHNFTEYAIDTTILNEDRKVFAGNKEKIKVAQ